ncbi:hypothetical protein B0H17DRAFT_1143726 [Mycena rosella]|uniref:Uncharacterized protein n=1 Tax=Mycena rosella TaxID=1033263 RepID=A0AAD7CV75_MYCRO|nr:hypothetical protein B0H17DRAFT_1143726 [Mycena rosella]
MKSIQHEQGSGTSLADVERVHETYNEIQDAKVPYFGPQERILAFIMKAHEPRAATGRYSVTPQTLRWATTQSPTVEVEKGRFSGSLEACDVIGMEPHPRWILPLALPNILNGRNGHGHNGHVALPFLRGVIVTIGLVA